MGLLFGGGYEIKHPPTNRPALNAFEAGRYQQFILLLHRQVDAIGTDFIKLVQDAVVIDGISKILQFAWVGKI